METKYGFPLVTAETIFPTLNELGVRQWEEYRPPMSREEYLSGRLTQEELAELRFAPAVEVMFLKDPEGKLGRYFRHHGRSWTTTFAILPGDLLPIVAEWKHGSSDISLVPPSGVPNKEDMKSRDPYGICAKREFEEETGLRLKEIIPLSQVGIPVSTRQSTQRYFPALGVVEEPIIRKPAKLDNTEFLKGVLIPLTEWLRLIDQGRVLEDCAISITFLALRHLGRLKLV